MLKRVKLHQDLHGSFDIEINVNDTDVSVRYDITLNKENLTNKNLKIKSVQETKGSNTLVQTGENTYTAVIPLTEIQKGNTTNRITIEVEWDDDGTNDEQDTQLGSIYNSKLEIPITIHVSQYLGEQIK